jgi:Domain of unknown function (DUF4145)
LSDGRPIRASCIEIDLLATRDRGLNEPNHCRLNSRGHRWLAGWIDPRETGRYGIQRSAAGRTARYVFDDAPSTLIKLRQLAEFLAKQVAARHGLLPSNAISFDEVLRTLKLRSILPPEVANLFFHLKRVGNAAVHENVGTTADALSALKIARGWFHQSYAIMPLSLTHPPFQTNTGPAAVLDEITRPGRALKAASASALGHPSRPPY